MMMPEPVLITLDSDAGTPLSVSFLEGSNAAPLIVFLNGLVKPAASFDACIVHFLSLVASHQVRPSVLTWDRYGQGRSGRQDKEHDAKDVIATMGQLLRKILPDEHAEGRWRKLILVANSIGCPLARLFAAQSSCVKGLLFLDSMIAHTDYISIFEARPDTKGEDLDELARAREIVAKIFAPDVPNQEGFNRLHLKDDVPYSNRPSLPGQPWITVVGHDPAVFAKDTEEKLGIPAEIVDRHLNEEWQKYNEGLTQLTVPSRARGPIIAEGADHFIQTSRPDIVAEELKLLWEKLLEPA